VPYNDLDAMRLALSADTAAVLIEVVQGEGGVNPGQPEYLRGVQALCQERGALLIVDEVQTGFGRTGALFACQHAGLQPDMLCLAKGLAGGVPMGAVLLGARVNNIKPGVHGSTFGGNPLACAAALAAIGYMLDNDLPAQAARKGAWALARLRTIAAPIVREVRGLGLMIGVDLRQRVTPYLKALMDEGVLALPAGTTVLRLLPPLVISDADLATACDAIERVLSAPA
jgi:acetylornithine/LysW-gamma-L-lysine aminotransferase